METLDQWWNELLDGNAGVAGSIADGGYGVTLPGPGVIVNTDKTISPDPTSLTSLISSDASAAGNAVTSAVSSLLPSASSLWAGGVGLIIVLVLVLLILGKFEAL
jgi:hypothetical protein